MRGVLTLNDTDPGNTAPADQVDGLLADALQLRERSIHALWTGTGGARETGVRSGGIAFRESRIAWNAIDPAAAVRG
jgi:hypothetical protein